MPTAAERLKRVTAAVLDVSEDSLNDDSSRDNIDSWDSLKHINLISALEQEFNIAFPDEEIMLLTSLSSLSASISNIIKRGE